MTGAVDLTDLDMWARDVPNGEFARLRREAPVAWHDEAPPNSGFWSVHCYQDIVTASRDVATFSSARGISFEEPTDEDMAARRVLRDSLRVARPRGRVCQLGFLGGLEPVTDFNPIADLPTGVQFSFYGSAFVLGHRELPAGRDPAGRHDRQGRGRPLPGQAGTRPSRPWSSASTRSSRHTRPWKRAWPPAR